MNRTNAGLGYLAIAVATGALAGAAGLYWRGEYDDARQHYVASASADTRFVADKVEAAFASIYENTRTLSFLPSIRSISRHGENLSEEAKVTIQQVYNNLASGVDVSEVYILPVDFDPERIDPATGRHEAPILMFDQLIVGGQTTSEGVGKVANGAAPSQSSNLETTGVPDEAGVPQIEIFEYRLLKQQLAWLQTHFPTIDKSNGMNVPMIGGREVITCDNSIFDRTSRDSDRAGIIQLVPFYGADGKLRGGVAAIMRSNALRDLLPGKDYALVNTAYNFMTQPRSEGQEAASAAWARSGEADPRLIYSEAAPVKTADSAGRWVVWAGRPDSLFHDSSEAAGVRYSALANIAAIGLLGLAAAALFSLIIKNMRAAALAVEGRKREASLARTDFLTGLPNRLAISEALPTMLRDILARDRVLGFIAIDLDGFKEINDTHGHHAGDAALVAVAERLRSLFPEFLIARVGGDEFVMVVDCVEAEQVCAIADQAAQALKAPMVLSDSISAPLGGSIGFAMAPHDGDEPQDLLRRSDLALFRAKREGRGRVCPFDAALEAGVIRRRVLEAGLRRALQRELIDVVYQPVLAGNGLTVVGVEALARWRDEDLGEISPVEFIPLAEETGLIVRLGEQVLKKALIDARAWSDLTLSVNISAQQIHRSDVVGIVETLLNDTGFPASRLELEVTESVLITDEARADSQIKALQGIGVKIALDDFGTGFASLLYLRRFGFDRLKIDQQFVKDSDTSADVRAMIVSIASMSRALGLDVTAEGVENRDQHQFLQIAGCDRLQGFLFSRPISAGRLSAFLENGPQAAPAAAVDDALWA